MCSPHRWVIQSQDPILRVCNNKCINEVLGEKSISWLKIYIGFFSGLTTVRHYGESCPPTLELAHSQCTTVPEGRRCSQELRPSGRWCSSHTCIPSSGTLILRSLHPGQRSSSGTSAETSLEQKGGED